MVHLKSSKRLMRIHISLICLEILGQEDELESRMTQMQEEEDDVDINTSDKSTPTHNQISGPITWARACQLNN
jgi:hypothetical protein